MEAPGSKRAGDPGRHFAWPHLTLLAPCTAVEQGVQQQLEGGGGPQVVEQLQEVGLGQEPFAPIEGLQREREERLRAPPGRRAAGSPVPLILSPADTLTFQERRVWPLGAPPPPPGAHLPGTHSPWPAQR